MEKSECIKIGRISKTFGYKGILIISIREGFDDCIQKEGSVFIEINEELVPFFIDDFQDDGDHFYRVHFEEINSVEEARTFAGLVIFLPKEVIPKSLLKNYLSLDIEGYSVEDIRFGILGVVTGLIELPRQIVLKVRHGKKEILIPYVSEFVLETDHKNKKIVLKTPEGLIDAYL